MTYIIVHNGKSIEEHEDIQEASIRAFLIACDHFDRKYAIINAPLMTVGKVYDYSFRKKSKVLLRLKK